MKKLIVLFLLCCSIWIVPVSANEVSDLDCRLTAGRIWRERNTFKFNEITTNNNIIYIETDRGFSPESKQVIGEMSFPYTVVFKKLASADSSNILKRYIITVGSPYIKYNGILLEWEEAPYWEDNIPMISFRELMDFGQDVSHSTIDYQWLDDEEQTIKFAVSSTRFGSLSVKNNTITILYGPDFSEVIPLEGKMKIINDKVYFPITSNNLFLLGYINHKISIDAETGDISITMLLL